MKRNIFSVAVLLASGGCCLDTINGHGSGVTTGTASTAGSPSTSGGGSCTLPKGLDGGPLVSTFAGNGTEGHQDGTSGPAGTAEFEGPGGLAFDASGNLYVADTSYNRICEVSPSGNVVTLAGGDRDLSAFTQPFGIAVDPSGSNIYVADTANSRICVVDTSGNVSTLAGSGSGPSGVFDAPYGVAVDAAGSLYVGDSQHNRIAKITPDGNVTTFAGNGQPGNADGTGALNGSAQFNDPCGVAIDSAGNLFVADVNNNRIRKVDPAGNVTTLAGNGAMGSQDGSGGRQGTATFSAPFAIAVDACDNVYVAEAANNHVRKIDPAGNVTTLAGNGVAGFAEGGGGANGQAEFWGPDGLAVDARGDVYVADPGNRRIRKITP